MPVTQADDRSVVATPDQTAPDHPTTDHPLVVLVPGLGLGADAWKAVRDELQGPSIVVLLPSLGQPAPRKG